MNKLKEVIAASGLRKNWIADKLNVKPSNISMWISEERKPSKARIRELCKVLKCKVGDIFPELKKRRQNDVREIEKKP